MLRNCFRCLSLALSLLTVVAVVGQPPSALSGTDHTQSTPQGWFAPSMTWTGSELILWGGRAPGYYLVKGWRYNPTDERWIPMSTVDAPTERARPIVAWTGSELIVWGGSILGCVPYYCLDGGRYDPVTDRWTAMATADGLNRSGVVGVWIGDELLLWGGSLAADETCFDPDCRQLARYDPRVDRWQRMLGDDSPPIRSQHTMHWTGRDVLVWGGLNRVGPGYAPGVIYNPSANSWRATSRPGTLEDRTLHSAVFTGTELLVWGGMMDGRVVGNGGRYHPETSRWQAISTNGSPNARYLPHAVWTGSEMIILGGAIPRPRWKPEDYRPYAAAYDPTRDTWRDLPDPRSPETTISPSVAWGGDVLWLWSGFQLFSYDPATNSWTIHPGPP